MRHVALTAILLLVGLPTAASAAATNVGSQQPALASSAAELLEASFSELCILGAGTTQHEVCEGDFCFVDDADSGETPAAAGTLSPELQELRDRVRGVLATYHRRKLNSRDHNPWEVMHAIIAYGVDSEMHRGGPTGETVNSIGWLCYNGACRGHRLLYIDGGRVAARKGPDVQGHYGQFLAILAQSRVKTDYPLLVDGKNFTIADLIESEKLGCQHGIELTFKLISLAHYLDLDQTWKSQSGEEWNVEKLVREELAAPIRGAACGGTHRLMGLAYAVNKRQRSGQPMSGDYKRAQTFLNDYHRYTLSLQNGDGSFSTEWFNRRGDRADLDRRLQTTGHILEWMAYSLPEESITDPRVVKAVAYLAGILQDGESRNWEIGPLGHAVHALAIYDSRVFKPHDTAGTPQTLARRLASPASDSAEAAKGSGVSFGQPENNQEMNSPKKTPDPVPAGAKQTGPRRDAVESSDQPKDPNASGPELFAP